ncbi:MAG: hypothetical protein OIF34_12090, partial [Porticoccaceae bacterium]|nr:hypothetical protein [Porticoccaceae bacterium]
STVTLNPPAFFYLPRHNPETRLLLAATGFFTNKLIQSHGDYYAIINGQNPAQALHNISASRS